MESCQAAHNINIISSHIISHNTPRGKMRVRYCQPFSCEMRKWNLNIQFRFSFTCVITKGALNVVRNFKFPYGLTKNQTVFPCRSKMVGTKVHAFGNFRHFTSCTIIHKMHWCSTCIERQLLLLRTTLQCRFFFCPSISLAILLRMEQTPAESQNQKHLASDRLEAEETVF